MERRGDGRHILPYKELPRKQRWGRWFLDKREPVSLNIMLTPFYKYEIDLATCKAARQRELWLRHMEEKRFITPHDVGDLATAFQDLEEQGFLRA